MRRRCLDSRRGMRLLWILTRPPLHSHSHSHSSPKSSFNVISVSCCFAFALFFTQSQSCISPLFFLLSIPVTCPCFACGQFLHLRSLRVSHLNSTLFFS